MTKMKKKLLAVVLSVVMIVALLVPMLAISADGPAATIYLGTPVILEGRDYDEDGVAEAAKLLGIPVMISNNNDEFYTAIYQVLSENGLKPHFASFGEGDDYYEDMGYDDGDFTKKIGAKWVALNNTISHNPNDTDKKGFQVVQDSNGGTRGISAESGTLITVYFEMPTTPGTYTFTLVWLSGTNNVPVDYTMAVNPATVTYKIDGTCAHPGEEKDTVNSVAAKCGVGGTDVFVCTECGEVLRTVPTAALEHAWDNGTTAANVPCGSTADIHYECTREGCNETKDVTGAVVDHDWKLDEAASTPAKCGVAGEKVYVCQNANCPVQTKTEPVDALEHIWDNGTVNSNAVCGQTADIHYECTREGCNGYKDVTGAVVEHNYVHAPALDTPAKCGVAGEKVYKCDRAGCPDDTKTEPIDALSHNWKLDEAASTPAKCGVAGEDVYVCQNANCPEGTKREPTDALEHDWEYSEELSQDPMCGIPGKTVYVCGNANCPVGTKETPIDALDHDYDYDYYEDMTVTKAPTADEVGKATIPCFHGCGATKEVDLDKLTNKVGDNESYISSKDNILPEDVNISINKGDEKDGKVEVEFTFESNIVNNLEGDIEYVLNISEAKKEYTNFKAYKVNADGTRTLVSEIKGDELVISANLKDTLVLTYEEIEDEKSPVTGDSMNVTVFAVIALLAVAGLVVIGKKRFAL